MIKSSIALGTLASLISVAAQASPSMEPLEFFTPGELIELGASPSLVYTVAATHVPVIKGDESFAFCSQEGYITYAGYNTVINAIIICLNHAPAAAVASSFTHEAVHLAQDCKAGIHNEHLATSSPVTVRNIWDYGLTEAQRENIKRSYDPTDWDIETEAFFFQNDPDTVEQAVSNFCF